MSSAISTERVRRDRDPSRRGRADAGPETQADQALQPWQFFVLAALACATAVTFLVRAQGITAVILLTVLMGAAALVGIAAFRTLRPLVTSEEDRTPMIGERTRAALEREKMLALRAIKDLEFDRAMGKIAEDDFREMTARLRARAARLIRQLDAGGGYRGQIERELIKRIGPRDQTAAAAAPRGRGGENPVAAVVVEPTPAVAVAESRVCAGCSTPNDPDARFCKSCGAKL